MAKIVNIKTPKQDSLLNIARGNIYGSRQAQIEGYLVGFCSCIKDISQLGVDEIPIPDISGVTMQISSTGTNDTVLGSGARAVTIEYIEPETELLKEIEVELNGTTDVTIPVSIGFVSDFYVSKASSLNTTSDGDITIYNGSTVYNIIKENQNKSLQPFRYIPKDKNLFISSCSISGNSKAVNVRLMSTVTDVGITTDSFLIRGIWVSADGISEERYSPPMVINGGNYVKMSIDSNTVDNGGMLSVVINGWLEDK